MIKRTFSIVFLLLAVLFAPIASAGSLDLGFVDVVASQATGACNTCHSSPEQARTERQQVSDQTDTVHKPRAAIGGVSNEPWGIKPNRHALKVKWSPD